MLENLENINLGKVVDTDFKESKSITIIRNLMEKNRKIKVRTQEADKIPNLDGKIMILDANSMERITVEVQIKTLPARYADTNPYKYSCDTKVFNVVEYNVTFNPVVLLMVDEANEKIFWKYISREYVKSLSIDNQKNKTIEFTDNDIYEENQFISSMVSIFKRLGIIIEKGSNPYLYINQDTSRLSELQAEVDRLNNIFDNDLKYVKDLLFPKVWKFGIAYSEYSDSSCLGIYRILKGKNDTLIRNFDVVNENYMEINYMVISSNKSIREIINCWIEKVLNNYYNKNELDPKFLPDVILDEIVFHFLDRLARDIKELQDNQIDKNYKNCTETLENVIKYYNGLKTFYFRLINELPNSQLSTALLNVYSSYGNRFLLFNPFLQTNKEEYKILIESINNPIILPYEINFVSSDVNIHLLELTLKELKERKKEKVYRVWTPHRWNLSKEEQKERNLRTQAHGYLINDLYNNLDKLFSNIIEVYNQTYKNIFKNNLKHRINGEFLIDYKIDEPYFYHLFYRKSKELNLKVKHLTSKEAIKEFGDFNYFERSSSGNIDTVFGIKLPMYNYIRFMINLGISISNGLAFKYDSEINGFYGIRELPIISDYIQLSEEEKKQK